jgi:beta-mannosidase
VVNWTLQNEPPFDAFWMKWKYPDYNPEQNRQLVDELRVALDRLDQTRWNLNYSATKTHPWLGWYSGSWRDYAKPAKSRWVTEFGAQALPGLDSLKKIFFAQDLWPDNDHKMAIWKYRNFQPRETFEIAGVSMGDDIETLVYNTQSYQSKITAFAARSLRRQKYAGVNGIFQFMFVENWPSVNWGVVDYWRELKPAYHALARAYQPVMPMIDWRDNEFTGSQLPGFPIWLLNDHWVGYDNATLGLSLTRDGLLVDQFREPVDLTADSASLLYRYQPVFDENGVYTLKLELHDNNGVLLGVDEHQFNFTGTALLAGVDE